MAAWGLVVPVIACGGCGLTLDYAPAQQRRGVMDAAIDAAHVDAANVDDAGPDAGPQEIDAASAEDAAASDANVRTDAAQRSHGDCVTSSDCGGGATCIELVAGGYRVCRAPVPTAHCDGTRVDFCCADGDCASGQRCFLGPVHPICSGIAPAPANQCAADDCAHDGDCPSGICTPAGVLAPVATCLDAECRHDSDCTEEAGGTCVLARDPCCSLPLALVCSYPRDGCITNADCGAGHCEIGGGRARCRAGAAACPD